MAHDNQDCFNYAAHLPLRMMLPLYTFVAMLCAEAFRCAADIAAELEVGWGRDGGGGPRIGAGGTGLGVWQGGLAGAGKPHRRIGGLASNPGQQFIAASLCARPHLNRPCARLRHRRMWLWPLPVWHSSARTAAPWSCRPAPSAPL